MEKPNLTLLPKPEDATMPPVVVHPPDTSTGEHALLTVLAQIVARAAAEPVAAAPADTRRKKAA